MKLDFGLARTFITDTPANLQWRTDGNEFEFKNVGGTGETVVQLDIDEQEQLEVIDFAWQNRPLNVSEAVERAKFLETWMIHSAHARQPDDGPLRQPFTILNGTFSEHAENWEDALATLSDDKRGIEKMRLYTLITSDTRTYVTAENRRRMALRFQQERKIKPLIGTRRTVFDDNGGYEWVLNIRIEKRRPLASDPN